MQSLAITSFDHWRSAVSHLQDAASLGVAGENCRLCGARIQTYLLEKAGRGHGRRLRDMKWFNWEVLKCLSWDVLWSPSSRLQQCFGSHTTSHIFQMQVRVCDQQEGERNYHLFYEVRSYRISVPIWQDFQRFSDLSGSLSCIDCRLALLLHLHQVPTIRLTPRTKLESSNRV